MSGRTKSRTWTDKFILEADPRTMDAAECVEILRSRGVDVPEGRNQRSQLIKLFNTLKQSIIDAAANSTPAPEGRKRANSRASTTKAAKKKETEAVEAEATPTRPRRKSGAAAAKKAAAVEEEPKPEEEQQPEEAEPENKRRRSSVKPAAKRKSSARLAAKRAAQEEEEPQQQEEEPQEKEQEQEKVQEPAKKQRKSTGGRGKKRAAEVPAEEIAAEEKQTEQQQQEEQQEEQPKKPANKRSRLSSKGRKKPNDEEPQQVPMNVEQEVRTESSTRSSLSKRKSVAKEQPVDEVVEEVPIVEPAKPNAFSLFFQNMATSVRSLFAKKDSEDKKQELVVPVPEGSAEEEALPVGTTVSNEPEEVVMNGEPAAVEEKKKGFVVTRKFEITAMSIGIALLVAFLSLFIVLSVKTSDVGDVTDTEVGHDTLKDAQNDLDKPFNPFSKPASMKDVPKTAEKSLFGTDCFNIMSYIVILLDALSVCVYLGLRYFKRYCARFTSFEDIKNSSLHILKEQASAAQAQADAMAGREEPTMPPYIPVEELKNQVLNDLPAEEQKNFVVRFRMFMVLRSLRNMPLVRVGKQMENGKPVETMKWSGSLDA